MIFNSKLIYLKRNIKNIVENFEKYYNIKKLWKKNKIESL